MKKKIALVLALTILILSGCRTPQPAGEFDMNSPETSSAYQTDPTEMTMGPVISDPAVETDPTESVSQMKPGAENKPDPTTSTRENSPEGDPGKNESGKDSDDQHKTSQTEPVKPTDPPVTRPAETQPDETKPSQTQPVETQPPTTVLEETIPKETEPPETEPPETVPEQTEPEETEPAANDITYEFKRQVASYAAQYINSYRGSPCTVLSGMSKVAQYRASQLTWNYGHSTADKRAALAYYEYGRYIDATEFGDDASNSYWEADSAEAICAGFYGTDPEAMGKRIADLIRNSSGHWSYISSSEYSYIGVGVEYREGSEYGWYCCVMVGSVNYG